VTYYRPAGRDAQDPRLGRLVPDDWRHYDKYPLTRAQAVALPPSPVVTGVNWYSSFGSPEQDSQGHWWIGRGPLGQIEGGHCVCLKPRGVRDNTEWWDYYNQGSEGRCVQFGISRAMTLLNRRRYEVRESHPQGRWLYWEAQRTDEWTGGEYEGAEPTYSGTSVRAGLSVVKQYGLIPYRQTMPVLREGIKEYRWIRSIDDLLDVLGYQGFGYVDLLQSWGRNWPHLVRVPLAVIDRLWREDGELGVITDRL
jgi:hypothetical protein